MINQFLQFLKKQRLAIRLARFDSLFVISGLQSFRRQMLVARMFVRRSPGTPLIRFQRFLQAENNPLLFAAYEEFTCRTDFLPFASYLLPAEPQTLHGNVCFRTTAGLRDTDFYLRVMEEIVNEDYPELSEQLEIFKKRLDAVFDMRFYASEIEMLCAEAGGSERGCPFEVDWRQTGRGELWLSFEKSYEFSAKLPLKAQESLSRLIACLIFDKAVFMSVFNGVAYNRQGRVCLPDIDYLYPVSPELRRFAVDCITHRKEPVTLAGYKMQRLLFLLEEYCPDIQVFESWKDYLGKDYRKLAAGETRDRELLDMFSTCGLDLCTRQPVVMTDPKDIAWLLDSRRHKQDPQFRKSSVFYWGPLFLIICFLFYYF